MAAREARAGRRGEEKIRGQVRGREEKKAGNEGAVTTLARIARHVEGPLSAAGKERSQRGAEGRRPRGSPGPRQRGCGHSAALAAGVVAPRSGTRAAWS